MLTINAKRNRHLLNSICVVALWPLTQWKLEYKCRSNTCRQQHNDYYSYGFSIQTECYLHNLVVVRVSIYVCLCPTAWTSHYSKMYWNIFTIFCWILTICFKREVRKEAHSFQTNWYTHKDWLHIHSSADDITSCKTRAARYRMPVALWGGGGWSVTQKCFP